MDHPTQNILNRLHIEIKNLTAANLTLSFI